MMKSLLASFAALLAVGASAQCDLNGHNFGDAPFGVSPDPLLGETFADGYIDVAYTDTIYVKIPLIASDIDPELPDLPVDSVVLEEIRVFNGGALMTLEALGLQVECENGGNSDDPCTYYGGSQGCARLFGTPTVSGTFNLEVDITGYVTVFGNPFSQVITYDQYTLFIDGPVGIVSPKAINFEVAQNIPNPFGTETEISFWLNGNSQVVFEVMNLLGEVVRRESIQGLRGRNTLKIQAEELNPGIYLYSIEAAGSKITRRMLVNR